MRFFSDPSSIPSLYGNIRVRENLYFGIFYAGINWYEHFNKKVGSVTKFEKCWKYWSSSFGNIVFFKISVGVIYFTLPLREKCPNTEFFLVRIWTLFTQFSPHSCDWHMMINPFQFNVSFYSPWKHTSGNKQFSYFFRW